MKKLEKLVKSVKSWVYNKRPSNKYLRIAYYSLTGLIHLVFMTILALMAVAVIGIVLGTLYWFIVYLINFNDYVRLIMKILVDLLLLLVVSFMGYVVGYIEFRDNPDSK